MEEEIQSILSPNSSTGSNPSGYIFDPSRPDILPWPINPNGPSPMIGPIDSKEFTNTVLSEGIWYAFPEAKLGKSIFGIVKIVKWKGIIHQHHIFIKAERKFFKSKGINCDKKELLVAVKDEKHIGKGNLHSSGYNKDWLIFKAEYGNTATQKQVIQFGLKMVKKYGHYFEEGEVERIRKVLKEYIKLINAGKSISYADSLYIAHLFMHMNSFIA
jgi:hypothetical protein